LKSATWYFLWAQTSLCVDRHDDIKQTDASIDIQIREKQIWARQEQLVWKKIAELERSASFDHRHISIEFVQRKLSAWFDK
jgi:hypothetical protein